MEVDDVEDPFVSIIQFCRPTASQEAKFQICPLARESENFADSNPEPFSSSPEPTPEEPTGIFMLSVPDSAYSVEHPQEDDPVFLTPPEQHLHSHLSSSEDQNPDVPCECAKVVDLRDGSGELEKVGVSEGRMDADSKSEKIRALGGQLEGETAPIEETIPAEETEPVVIANDGCESVNNDEVIILDSEGCDEEANTVNLGEDSAGKTVEDSGEVNKINAVRKFSKETVLCERLELVRELVPVIHEKHEPIKKGQLMKEHVVNRHENSLESEGSDGRLGGHKTEEDICKLKQIRDGKRGKTGTRGSCEVPVTKTSKDKGRENGDERIQGVGKSKPADGGAAGRKRQLPPSFKGKEKKNVPDPLEKNCGLLDILDDVKGVLGVPNNGCEDEDFLETARNCGFTFPRPRWWDPEGDKEH